MTAPAAAAPQAIRAVPVRHWGRYVSGAVVLALLGLLVRGFAQADVHWSVTRHYLFDGAIITGAERTLLISAVSQAVGIALGVLVAVMRQSGNPVTGAVGWLYVWLFRGTPVLVQLFLWYNLGLVFSTLSFPGLGSTPTSSAITPFVAALLGLGLNEGAYMAEIVRAGIASVDVGQTEAAQALGMTRVQTMRRIVLPQAMRVIIPPTGNEFINMLKTSSLAYAITYGELTLAARDVYTNNFRIFELLFVSAFWYLVLTSVFSVGQYFLERRFSRGTRRDDVGVFDRVRGGLVRPRL